MRYTLNLSHEELDTVAKALATYAEEQRQAAEVLRQTVRNRHTIEVPESRAALAEEMLAHINTNLL